MKEFEAYIIEDGGHLKPVKVVSKPKGGTEAVFVQISKTQGIKAFETMTEATRSHERQSKAWAVNVAPKVCSRVFEIVMPVGGTHMAREYCYTAHKIVNRKKMTRRMYGYETQVATRVGDFDFESRKYSNLCSAFEKLELDASDLHEENVGWIGDRLVCIDFGDASV